MPNRCTVTLRAAAATASVLELLRRERFLDNDLSRPVEIYASPGPGQSWRTASGCTLPEKICLSADFPLDFSAGVL